MKTIKNIEQELAFAYVSQTNRHIYLTGKAGTGKTTFLHRVCKEIPKRKVVVAPTGVAAINAKGMTIHSLFQLPFGPLPPEKAKSELRKRAFSSKKISLLKSLDLLIIDEISMVRADVLDAIDIVLRKYRDFRTPFGGVQLLMIGDLHQLPPVIKDNEWDLLRTNYQTPYFFGSLALQQTGLVAIELKHIYRQSDDDFILLLNKVRNNQIDQTVLNQLNRRYQPDFNPNDQDGYITLTSHNSTAQQINQEHLDNIPGLSRRFKAKIVDDFPEHAFPTAMTLAFKVGAQVMFIKNDNMPEKRYYNGKIGKILSISDEEVYVKCPGNDESIVVNRHVWDNRKFEIDPSTKQVEEKIIGTFEQFPLKLAWAITIHKSQGLTFEKVIIDAQAAFAHGQVYVALSRCKSFEGIVLRSQLQSSSVKTDRTIQQYTEENNKNIPTEEKLAEDKRHYQELCIKELFDFSKTNYQLSQLRRAILETEHTLQGNELKAYEQLKSTADQKVIGFAHKFSLQLPNYFSKGPLPEENIALSQRLSRASQYFLDQLSNTLLPLAMNFQILSDNKSSKKLVTERLKDVQRSLFVKQSCFGVCKDKFRASSYVKARAESYIQFDYQKTKKKKASEIPDYIEHPALYRKFLTWRSKKAKASKQDAYFVLPTKSLIEIVQVLPTTHESLRRIGKLGSKRIKESGLEILNMVIDYCDAQEIQTNQLQFDSLKAKPDTKKMSFDLLKMGKNPLQIAEERQLTIGTIYNHLGHFVQEGKLNIFDLVDKEKVHQVAAFYESSNCESLNEAKSYFGDQYSYDELRLIYRYWSWLQSSNDKRNVKKFS